jgi:hypothetical protein
VGLRRLLRRYDEQLPAHPEVTDERVAGVERQPQVLAAAQRRVDTPAGEQVDEVALPGQVTADRARVRHGDRGDPAPDDAAGETEADDLDLGQLRQR